MTETGEYTITFYNRKGSKLRDKTLVVGYLTQARERGREERAADKELASFTVDRRVYNSMDDSSGQ